MGNKVFKKQLSKPDLEFLKLHTKYPEAEIKAWYNNIQQVCPDGRMNEKEFLKNYQNLFPEKWENDWSGKNTKDFTDFVFQAFDEDKNQFLEFREFLLFVNYISDGTPEEKLEWSFKIYDINGNGKISQTELFKILKALFVMFEGNVKGSATATEVLMQKMDKNKDGTISIREFVNGCLNDKILYKLLIEQKVVDVFKMKN